MERRGRGGEARGGARLKTLELSRVPNWLARAEAARRPAWARLGVGWRMALAWALIGGVAIAAGLIVSAGMALLLFLFGQ